MGESLPIDVTAVLRQGVYLLSREGRIVYVGQSRCMLARIAAHRSLARRKVPSWLPIRGVVFDSVAVIPCHPDRIDALERTLIELHKPVSNRALNPEPAKYPGLHFPPKPAAPSPIFTARL